jgi:hypothetical protein
MNMPNPHVELKSDAYGGADPLVPAGRPQPRSIDAR